MVQSLKAEFPQASIIDRRETPSHGYRAVHVVVEVSGKPVEIQVRTGLQHLRAELSEKASDVIDPTIKYGGGPEEWRELLAASSTQVSAFEKCERMAMPLDVSETGREDLKRLDECLSSYEMHETQNALLKMRDVTMNDLNMLISLLNNLKRQRQGFS